MLHYPEAMVGIEIASGLRLGGKQTALLQISTLSIGKFDISEIFKHLDNMV
jgi:hypothetical protein